MNPHTGFYQLKIPLEHEISEILKLCLNSMSKSEKKIELLLGLSIWGTSQLPWLIWFTRAGLAVGIILKLEMTSEKKTHPLLHIKLEQNFIFKKRHLKCVPTFWGIKNPWIINLRNTDDLSRSSCGVLVRALVFQP